MSSGGMMSGDAGSAPAVRLWWAAPLALVVVTAVVFVAVVLPALAGGSRVPAQLIVHRSPGSSAPTPSAALTPPPQPTASPVPTHSTTVVRPTHPVIRETESADDSGGQRSGEPNDR